VVKCKTFYPRERTPVHIKQWAGWDPELVWTFWRSDKSLVPAGIQTPDRPDHSVIFTLSRYMCWYRVPYICLFFRKKSEQFGSSVTSGKFVKNQDMQCTYVCNIQARSLNHRGSRKVINITYWLCCRLRYPARTAHEPSVACPILKYYFTLSHKRHDFRKNIIKHEMFVLIFSTTFV